MTIKTDDLTEEQKEILCSINSKRNCDECPALRMTYGNKRCLLKRTKQEIKLNEKDFNTINKIAKEIKTKRRIKNEL